ncbi:uncharacterized protein LOC132952712 [Metopolophium dirhodum]|uniref:uncharacterized protein LOC132952712 n=1 Tax=Metopolophium dirhodum TaxID=44670 RepID=UPI00299005B8|nr:uncharacterized protein LOC132952712 [Metopolophium dirhodum]
MLLVVTNHCGAMLVFEVNVKELLKPQRKMAIRVSYANCTVSTNAILVVSGLLPLHIKVLERTAMRVAQKAGSTLPSKKELREESLSKWQNEWEKSVTGEWTRRLIPDVRLWVSRSFGPVNFHITQFLTGHRCFGMYLWRFKKLDTPVCHNCQAPMEHPEHAFFICDHRRRQEFYQGGALCK